jgi:intracellular sulfur oxidation DsrE/DsrF family protein
MKVQHALLGALLAAATPASAGPDDFSHGPAIPGFGAVAKVDTDLKSPASLDYKVAFDIGAGKRGEKSKGLESAARLMNMLAASGVPMSRIHPAVVVHNAAMWDVVSDARYGQQFGGAANPNAGLVRALIAKGVPIYVCGQTAAWSDVGKADFIPGVKMALSAMDAHAILQHQGYSLNPF